MTPGPVAGAPPRVEGYSDLGVIGHGASSTVYRATQDNYDRQVALKVLNVDVSDRRAQRRFTRERALNGRLSHHPNVVTVLDSGFVDGRYPFLVMELFEQGSLTDRLAARGPFDVALALQIGVRISGALETAHRIGVLHRDVKPQNILFSRFGEPALADFGIAAILEMEASITAGLTPVHAAPEILEGADPSAQADVYALGSTIFTLLAGAAPFAGPPGEGMLAQLLRITTSDLPAMPRRDVPESVVELLRWSTAKHLEERAPSALALGVALQGLQTELGQPVTALPVETVDELPATPTPPPPLAITPAESTIDARVVETPPAPATPSVTPVDLPRPAPGAPLDAVAWAPPAGTAQVPDVTPEAPVPAAVARDDTVGAPRIDTPTILGRHQAPDATVAPRARRTRRLAITAVVVAPAVAIGIAVFTLGDDGSSAAPTTPSTVPGSVTPTSSSGTVATTIDPDLFAPTDFAVSVDTGAVVLTWTDHTDGAVGQLIETQFADDTDPDLEAVERGVEIHTVEGLDPSTPACFRVRAVLSTSEPQAVTANSDWACIGGATPVGAPTITVDPTVPPTT